MTCVGSPKYMAIEIMEGDSYSAKCDVFSLGVTLYELIFGNESYPF